MNRRIRIAPLVLASLMLGCHSQYQGDEHAPVVYNIETVHQQLADASGQVQRMDALLGELQSGGDPKATFDRFDAAMVSLVSSADQARQRGQGMRESRDEYLAQWEREIRAKDDLNVQDTFVERRQVVQSHFGKITSLADGVRSAFAPYVKDLDQIHRALSDDLSASQVQNLQPTIARAKADGQRLSHAIEQLNNELDILRGTIRPIPTN